MFGNDKGEVIVCHNCRRIHDIRRCTRCFCACGEELRSKDYNHSYIFKRFIHYLKSEIEKKGFMSVDEKLISVDDVYEIINKKLEGDDQNHGTVR